MDIVVRTPHGDADVTIVSQPDSATVGELIGTITGQAAPRVASIDGRTVDGATPLRDAGLVLGSIITTDPPAAEPNDAGSAAIAQVAGHGAGRIRTLAPGRYRLGPGRRSTAEELATAPVETPRFTLEITEGPALTVEPIDEETALRIDGTPIASAQPWSDGVLSVAGKAFVLDGRADIVRRLPDPESNGTIPFNRPPRHIPDEPRFPVIDGVRDARFRRTTLWQQRPGEPGSFTLPVGLSENVDDPPSVALLDLFTERHVAVVGGREVRTALARTLLIEATTLHGPADLGVVIATAPGGTAPWDWAKWLPHIRLGGRPMVVDHESDVAAWVSAHNSQAAQRTTRRLTLLVIDDEAPWRRRHSPLGRLLSAPPPDVRVIALCEDSSHAPASCTAMITETTRGQVRLQQLGSRTEARVIPALVEIDVAADVARALAPLADTELPPTEPNSGQRCSLTTTLGLDGASADDVARRWNTTSASFAIGHRGDDRIEIAIADHDIIVTSTDLADAARTAASIVAGACSVESPSALRVLPLVRDEYARPLSGFPHAETISSEVDTTDPDRLLARLAHVLASENGPERILAIVDVDVASSDATTELIEALLAGSTRIAGLRVLAIMDTASSTPDADALRIDVQNRSGRRYATTVDAQGYRRAPFLLEESAAVVAQLQTRAWTVGRPLTPLEHRMEQRARQADGGFSAEVDNIVRLTTATAGASEDHPSLIPSPLPIAVDTDSLFDAFPGDAIPIGLLDRPATGAEPLWWRPGDGSLLLLGNARSGIDDTLSTVLLGIADRFSADDLAVVVVDRSGSRRTAVRALPHAADIIDPDNANDLEQLVTRLETPAEGPTVVLIDDLGHLRSRAEHAGSGSRLDQTMSAVFEHDDAIDIIAAVRDVGSAGPLVAVAPQRIVGALSDPEDATRLGLPAEQVVESERGRCRRYPAGDVVQLSQPERPITATLAERVGDGRDHDRMRS